MVAACGISCCGFSGVEPRVMRPVCRMLVYWLIRFLYIGLDLGFEPKLTHCKICVQNYTDASI